MNKNYENVKKWREENKEKFKEQRKRYYEKNKEKLNGRINEYRSKQVEELRAKGCTNAWQVIRHKVEPKYDYKVYKSRIDKAIEFIDQVLQYHITPFQPNEVDEDINTLIGILRDGSNER